MRFSGAGFAVGLFLSLWACGSEDASGDAVVTVILESEDVIQNGLRAGNEPENVADGWDVTFDKYVMTVGEIELYLATDHDVAAHDEAIFAVDLTKLPLSGESLWRIEGLTEGTFEFGYVTEAHEPTRHSSVEEEDFEALVEGELTHLIAGVLESAEGLSCPPSALAEVPSDLTPMAENEGGDPCYEAPSVEFSFGLNAPAVYGPCEIDGVSGVAATSGSETTVAVTIHGDHIFFNGFPEGSEGGVMRLSQWLADCDLDLDGVVTEEELLAIAPADLPVIDERYQLGGSPITPLDNMMTYLKAQLMTQGHFQGEGECALNGEEHDH